MHPTLSDLRQTLEEKLLIVGNNKKYGQVVFLAGGAGSGKGFAISNLIGMGNPPKVFDPDAMKTAFIRWNTQAMKHPEIAAICNPDGKPTEDKPCMKDPKVTEKLHGVLASLGWDDKSINQFLTTKRSPDLLPNIVFDRTFRNMDGVNYLLPTLKQAGYKPENIHIIWVLTDYRIAARQNLTRDRTVPPEILFNTHDGAAKTMLGIVTQKYPVKEYINGEVWTIVGRANKVVSDKGGSYIIKPDSSSGSLKFIKIKSAGRDFESSSAVWNKLGCHICANTPLSDEDICRDKPPQCN